jgi:glucose/arabinose dehydrogenase
MTRSVHVGAASLLLSSVLALPATAAPLISNGGFESGFAGWIRADAVGSEGTFHLQTGTASPVLGDPVPAPPGPTQAAMTDAEGPGSHVLYQDFLVPADVTTGVLSFDVFVGNRAEQFETPATLDFSTPTLNQQARVDFLLPAADPFSVAPADVLLTVFQTQVGDALVSGYSTVSTDVSALLVARAGQTLRLRFAEVDNVFPFQFGVDNVSLETQPIPEPGSLLLIGSGLLLGARRRLRSMGPASPGPALRRLGTKRASRAAASLGVLTFLVLVNSPRVSRADTIPVSILDPNLQVTTVLDSGISQPIGIVFLGSATDFWVLEKASGQIKRVIAGVVQSTPVLDLPVNSNSERGLLDVVLHPAFPATPWVYVRWTQSSTGADSTVATEVPLVGNRLDRFMWDSTAGTLAFDRNIVMLRALQTDNIPVPGHPGTNNNNPNGNHNGGVLRFGPDGKLYLYMGDQGRRGTLQNLVQGPFLTPPFVDDTFGGPEPDNAHLTGVILRLNDDGTTPSDNPFSAAGQAIGGEVGASIQKIFSYGHRNGFGMAFDPYSGALWETENGDDSYSELNRAVPGMNGGWIQIAGPISRMGSFKTIETTQFGRALQQVRYPPTRLAYTPGLAAARLFMLPGATYVDPELSWRYEIGPAGTTFVQGNALGSEYDGTLWIGSARSFQQVGANGGSLYRLRLTADRLHVDVSADPRLADRVADNLFRQQKFDGTESETLLIGTGFGATPDIEQGPDGNLYVVSITDGAIYMISRRP